MHQLGGPVASNPLVYDETYHCARSQANNDGQGYRATGQTQADSCDEDDGLGPFAEDGHERQPEHEVLPRTRLDTFPPRARLEGVVLFEGSNELGAPFGLKLGNAEQSGAHDGDDERSDDAERPLPVRLSSCPVVDVQAVEGSDHASTDDEAYQEAGESAVPYLGRNGQLWVLDHVQWTPYLTSELLACLVSTARPKCLLLERQKKRDNDGHFDGFSEDNEEDCLESLGTCRLLFPISDTYSAPRKRQASCLVRYLGLWPSRFGKRESPEESL